MCGEHSVNAMVVTGIKCAKTNVKCNSSIGIAFYTESMMIAKFVKRISNMHVERKLYAIIILIEQILDI